MNTKVPDGKTHEKGNKLNAKTGLHNVRDRDRKTALQTDPKTAKTQTQTHTHTHIQAQARLVHSHAFVIAANSE